MKNRARTTILLVGDVLALVVAFWGMIYVSFYGQSYKNIVALHLVPFSILGILWIIIFFVFNLYDTEASRPTIPHLPKIFGAFIVALVVSAIFFYTLPFFKITPKTNLVIFGGITLLLFTVWRRIFYNILASHFRKRVVFAVGKKNNRSQIEDLVKYITECPQAGFEVYGIYDTLQEFFDQNPTETPEVFIVSKEIWRESENFKSLYGTESEIMDLAHAYEDILGRIPLEAIDEGWFMHNVRSHQKKIYDSVKRFLSIFIALVVLAVTSPLLIIIALLIKLYDGGPVFYSQSRVGKNGKIFNLYKFRSMKIDAEKDGPEWSSKSDPRATLVGKILRRLHIDEIPQMINVIKGDISLVGPRPERLFFVENLEKEIPFYHLRHIIAPGFTGWAQIKFRYAGSVMDSKQKFEYDLYYLKNRNIFMDFGILIKTIQIIFTH